MFEYHIQNSWAGGLPHWSRDELIRDVLFWTPTHGRAKAGRPARTYIQQLCEDTGCCPEDLPRAMNDREEWRERVSDIRATSATWWWWWWWEMQLAYSSAPAYWMLYQESTCSLSHYSFFLNCHDHTKILNVNYGRILWDILKKNLKVTTLKTSDVRQLTYNHKKNLVEGTRHVEHCWRSKNKVICNVFQWTPSHGRVIVGWQARTYTTVLCGHRM